MRRAKPRDISKIFAEGTLIDKAIATAVREALLQHKRAGNPVAEWRDGKVVWVPPEQIVVDAKAARRRRARSRAR
ncbi:MAG: hypothetical protein NTW87_19850 [Planctomycetota bacterium]|nr:hypothetical protein [Planctomycetota bacterium]